MAVYDRKSFIEDYKNNGNYPKIHDNIFNSIAGIANSEDVVVDLGTCYGLLAKRIVDKLGCKAIGIDSNAGYIKESIKDKKINYLLMEINDQSISKLSDIIESNHVNIIVARRVFPEIYNCSKKGFLNTLAESFYDNGIRYIVLEGRIDSKRSVNKLHNVYEEIKQFNNFYRCISENKRVAILERVK